jgi:hypothetical protein
MQYELIQGDCIDVLKELDDDTFDSVVTDPPYALSFMGKDWDSFGANGYQDWCERWAAECLRVLKPGGFLLAFGGTRTYHRLACAIEDAGFEIRDSLHWIYGSGFPKSMDVSKSIDKAAGAVRQPSGVPTSLACEYVRRGETCKGHGDGSEDCQSGSTIHALPTAPATAAAETWAGWGTALKPAHEPIVMARKPLAAKTVTANVLGYGTGGINIAGCRVGSENRVNLPAGNKAGGASLNMSVVGMPQDVDARECEGRWPPNVVLTHSPDCTPIGTKRVKTSKGIRGESPDGNGIYNGAFPRGNNQEVGYADADGMETVEAWDCAEGCPIQEMDRQSGTSKSTAANGVKRYGRSAGIMGDVGALRDGRPEGHDDAGGASRFFPCFRYQAKASKKERPVVDGIPGHPTVKPVALMQWLVRLVTPPSGLVLDPFAGTGTTAEACEREGFDCLLIERDSDSILRIEKRMIKYEG